MSILSQRRGTLAAVASVGLTLEEEILADTPLRYYKHTEASGTTAIDSSGNGANANYHNSPSLGSTPGPIMGETAVTFTRASDHLIYRDSETGLFGGGTLDLFTLELWLKRSATQSLEMGLHSWNAVAGTYYLYLDTDNKVKLQIVAAAVCVVSTAALVDTASWHHICVAHDTTSSILYVDNADVSASQVDAEQYATSGRICIGAQANTGSVLDGSMAHAAIYGTKLSAARIAAHYNARA
jgi:concanavalin A-like lectin/glucanase superfamily protein